MFITGNVFVRNIYLIAKPVRGVSVKMTGRMFVNESGTKPIYGIEIEEEDFQECLKHIQECEHAAE